MEYRRDALRVKDRFVRYSGLDPKSTLLSVEKARLLSRTFQFRDEGMIAYKTFGLYYDPPLSWLPLKKGKRIEEAGVNTNCFHDCGCGINIGTLDSVKTAILEKLLLMLPCRYLPEHFDDKVELFRFSYHWVKADGVIWQVLLENEYLDTLVIPNHTLQHDSDSIFSYKLLLRCGAVRLLGKVDF